MRCFFSLSLIKSGLSFIFDIQTNPLMIKPETIVDNDQVDALNDKASVLLSFVVCRMINGNEHTLNNIIPIPQSMKES